MKVKIIRAIGSKVDGVAMGPYAVGQEYDMEPDRALLFVSSGIAEAVVEPVAETVVEDAPIAIDEPDTAGRRRRK
jgi:hypothetical protein